MIDMMNFPSPKLASLPEYLNTLFIRLCWRLKVPSSDISGHHEPAEFSIIMTATTVVQQLHY